MAEELNETIIIGQSLSSPPYFDGTNYIYWKERMEIFIQALNFKLWLVIKNGPNIPKKVVEGEEVEKSEDEFNDEDKKNMEQNAKAKYIFHCAINPKDFKKISSCETAKQMWDELDRQMTDPIPDSTTQQQHLMTTPADDNSFFYFLQDTREARDAFLNLCVPLHMFAQQGNWPAAKRILDQDRRLRNKAIAEGWRTVLHVAACTNHVHFVEELLKLIDDRDLALQDYKGNTAFCFAAAGGNLEIAKLMLERNPFLPRIRGGDGNAPVQFAALQGRSKMAWHLYRLTKDIFVVEEWKEERKRLFFTCINTGMYDLALDMVKEREELAFARDENEETGLHLLAQKPLDSCCQCPEPETPITINPDMKQNVALQLVNFLWNTILRKGDSRSETTRIISEPYPLLFRAAEVGNFGFLSELVSAYPKLIWESDGRNRSIIHIAVLHRHASIYNVIHEIGNQKDIILTYEDVDDNTLLHLAARSAPPGQLELVSGAAFQMSHELLWFEEVKKIMPPSSIEKKNSDNLTARELFTREHAQLREKAEKWMKRTAEFGMLISTVIATGVFSAAITLPGGINDNTGIPNFLKKPSFLVFEISDATAFISAATSILIFLSILVSRYTEYDFYKSLPLKLICGLITLFISITSMMIAFGCAFFITYYHGLKWVPSFISILACLPILLFMFLQYSLWSDIIYSTYYCRNIFKPGKKMFYVLEK